MNAKVKRDAPFFSTPGRQLALITVARAWLGTPFRDHCAIRGIGADCAGFVHAVLVDVGAIDPLDLPDYALDEGSHSNQSKLARVLADTGCFVEMWKRENVQSSAPGSPLSALRSQLDPVPVEVGDLLGFNLGRSTHHIGLVVSNRIFIHAIHPGGVVESHLEDGTYRRRLANIWRCMEAVK